MGARGHAAWCDGVASRWVSTVAHLAVGRVANEGQTRSVGRGGAGVE